MRKTFIAISLFICLFFLCAGIGFAQRINYNMKYDPEKSYVYGLFSKTYETGLQEWNMGIVLENAKIPKTYTIKFPKKEGVKCVDVKPGSYRIVEIVYLHGAEVLGKNDLRTHDISRAFNIEEGQAVYIGDWKISITQKGEQKGRQIGNYNIDSFVNNFEKTTEQLHKLYKYFDSDVSTASMFGP
jgi:hypothetical protein